jgi:hypothetical protein
MRRGAATTACKQAAAREAFRTAVANLENTVDADHPKLVLAHQLLSQISRDPN